MTYADFNFKSCINNHDSGNRCSITVGELEFCGGYVPAREPAIEIGHVCKTIHIVWDSQDWNFILDIDMIIEYLDILVFRYFYCLRFFFGLVM